MSLESTDSLPPPYQQPPPTYESALDASVPQERPQEKGRSQATGPNEPTTLTIDGRYIYSSQSPGEPIYSLSRELDGHEVNSMGIGLTLIEKKHGRTRKTDVFALWRSNPLNNAISRYQIDGTRFASKKKGTMNKTTTRNGRGWSAHGKGLPHLEARPASLGIRKEEKRYEWEGHKDKKQIIKGVETRRKWDKEAKVPLSNPKMEMEISNIEDPDDLDFFVAAWCMHNWLESKEITKEALTWEEFKDQAKVTKKNWKARNSTFAPGLLGAGLAMS